MDFGWKPSESVNIIESFDCKDLPDNAIKFIQARNNIIKGEDEITIEDCPSYNFLHKYKADIFSNTAIKSVDMRQLAPRGIRGSMIAYSGGAESVLLDHLFPNSDLVVCYNWIEPVGQHYSRETQIALIGACRNYRNVFIGCQFGPDPQPLKPQIYEYSKKFLSNWNLNFETKIFYPLGFHTKDQVYKTILSEINSSWLSCEEKVKKIPIERFLKRLTKAREGTRDLWDLWCGKCPKCIESQFVAEAIGLKLPYTLDIRATLEHREENTRLYFEQNDPYFHLEDMVYLEKTYGYTGWRFKA